MICQDCQEKMATILFTQIIDNKKTVLHLCAECAQKRGLQIAEKKPVDPINDFLAGMVEEEEAGRGKTDQLACAECGLTYKEFRKSGKLGCASCYPTFDAPLKKLLRKIHGNTVHHGKQVTTASPAQKRAAPNLAALKQELNEAVAKEEFEKAAQLRDRIRQQGKDDS